MSLPTISIVRPLTALPTLPRKRRPTSCAFLTDTASIASSNLVAFFVKIKGGHVDEGRARGGGGASLFFIICDFFFAISVFVVPFPVVGSSLVLPEVYIYELACVC